MKVKSALCCSLMLFSISAFAEFRPAGNEVESISEAIRDGYQVQRNLAFQYREGRGKGVNYLPKDRVKACAWRKILLIANPDKINDLDADSERSDCGGLEVAQDYQVWLLVHQYLPAIEKMKQEGKYMLPKPDAPISAEPIIVDVE
ncbi:hypothetical protein EYD79_00940 [Shigella sonnei]|nr:hypothetical protein [Escherichia coli]EFW5532202.1 hypothetical protein [Shigella sonnei]EFZ0655764.1 hypothetical protein [Shigella sonnei]EFZ2872807.1 hypothetical protein [Shigella sonnei]EFZ3697871.1 hypothetical protein [Shigella sonnei]